MQAVFVLCLPSFQQGHIAIQTIYNRHPAAYYILISGLIKISLCTMTKQKHLCVVSRPNPSRQTISIDIYHNIVAQLMEYMQ